MYGFDFARARWYVAAVLREVLLASLVWCAWAAGVAHAYEDQITLGAELGYAASAETALPAHGASVGAAGSLGLSDTWSLRGRLAYAWHPAERPGHVGIAGAEIVYLLDVLQVVPFFGLGADALAVSHGGEFGIDPAVHAVIGVDYLLDWDWTLGFEARPMLRIAGLMEPRMYVMANVRLSFVFDM